jgi:hypothetical protein
VGGVFTLSGASSVDLVSAVDESPAKRWRREGRSDPPSQQLPYDRIAYFLTSAPNAHPIIVPLLSDGCSATET